MNITRQDVDDLNSILKIEIEKDDYQPKVEKVLKDYRKKANMPGFRQGHVPMSLIKKQYEKSVVVDEVNKLLQNQLNSFLTKEKIDILGQPIPKQDDDFTWDADNYSFDFEIGLAPTIDINLEDKSPLINYEVEVDDDLIKDEKTALRKQYGKIVSDEEAKENSNLIGVFRYNYKEQEQENNASIEIEYVKNKTTLNTLLGKKIGDNISISPKDLFKDDHVLMHALKLDHDDAHNFEQEVSFTINEINHVELAELNEEFFNKIFGEGNVSNEDEMNAKIKETLGKQLKNQADQMFLNKATDYLIEKYNFDLPTEFLQKWLQFSGEKPMTEEEAKVEYERSEKGLRYQLIEGNLAKEHKLNVTIDELKSHTKSLLKAQYTQFASEDLMKDDFLDGVVDKVMGGDQNELRRLSEQVMSQKLLDLYKNKMNYETKTISYKDFIEEMHKTN